MRQFDQELRDLRDGILAMAGLSEQMIDLTIQALTERSKAKSDQVMAMDRGLDEWELKLDRLCVDLLALRAPAAGDLRLIASSLKIVPELERIGDHCCNIARRATYLPPPILARGSSAPGSPRRASSGTWTERIERSRTRFTATV